MDKYKDWRRSDNVDDRRNSFRHGFDLQNQQRNNKLGFERLIKQAAEERQGSNQTPDEAVEKTYRD